MNNQKMSVNIVPGISAPSTLHASEGDVGRTCEIIIIDGASAYKIPSTATVTITATKPSGMGFTQTCAVTENGTATFETTASMTDESGKMQAEVRIVEGGKNIGTANLLWIVERNPHPSNVIDGDVERAKTILERADEAMTKAEQMIEEVEVYNSIVEEVEDARKGFDGVEYGTLGEAVRGQVSDLSDGINGLKSDLIVKKIELVKGRIEGTGAGLGATVDLKPTSSNAWMYAIVNCKEGDAFTLNNIGGDAYRAWCFINSSNTIIDYSGTVAYGDNTVIYAPLGSSKLIIHHDASHFQTVPECWKGIPLSKIPHTKRRRIPLQWLMGQITSSGISNSTTNIRTFYSIGFSKGEKLIITNTSNDLYMTAYGSKQSSFNIMTNNFLHYRNTIVLDDWTQTYFLRVRNDANSTDITPEDGAYIYAEVVRINVPDDITKIVNSTSPMANREPVGFDRQYQYLNPMLTFQQKDVDVNGALIDSTTRCTVELPNIGCAEVKAQRQTGAFKVIKITGGTVTTVVPEWSYYTHRYIGDGTSIYYAVISQGGTPTSAMTVSQARQDIGVYLYNDCGKRSNILSALIGKHIAFIGDSITQGRFSKFGAKSPNWTAVKPFGSLVSEEIGDRDYGNYGIGGACVYNNNWRSLYANCDKVTGYDVVFVCGGTNDYGNNISRENFTDAYNHVISTLMANNTEVVVCTPVVRTSKVGANESGLSLYDYASIEMEIANTNGLKYIDLWTLTNNNRFVNYIPDGLHPDEMGHKAMAEHILNGYNEQAL